MSMRDQVKHGDFSCCESPCGQCGKYKCVCETDPLPDDFWNAVDDTLWEDYDTLEDRLDAALRRAERTDP